MLDHIKMQRGSDQGAFNPRQADLQISSDLNSHDKQKMFFKLKAQLGHLNMLDLIKKIFNAKKLFIQINKTINYQKSMTICAVAVSVP